MKHSRAVHFCCHWRWPAVALGFAIASLHEVQATEMTGIYENLGTRIASEKEPAGEPVSLRGLFGLEFDYPLARAVYSQTDRVLIRQSDALFTIRCLDSDGKETWNGQWNRNEGYGVENGQVNLVFRSKRHEFAGFLFSLSLVGEQKILMIEVTKISTTLLGPSTKLVGLYLFPQALSGKNQSEE